jgi:hypothetical protein
MTDQHPITPPPELVKQWIDAPHGLGLGCHAARSVPDEAYAQRLIEAAQWGAEQELEACLEWAKGYDTEHWSYSESLRAVRRPKPPSLKEQALEALNRMDQFPTADDQRIIRQALEQLND